MPFGHDGYAPAVGAIEQEVAFSQLYEEWIDHTWINTSGNSKIRRAVCCLAVLRRANSPA